MTHAMKNKIWIFVWLLTLGLLAYGLLDRVIPLWEKLLMLSLATFTGILNILSRIRNDKDIRVCNDTLFVKKTFSKEKEYSLKNVLGWSENHYSLLGVKTNSIITIKTESGEKVNLYRRGTRDYEKVSDYLNDNFSAKYENYR